MARDYLTIGSSPHGEPCAQIGADDYYVAMRRETKAYIAQLRRQFGPEPHGASLAVKSFPHDFGNYHEVVCWYDDSLQESVDYAFKLESDGPESWDEKARAELKLFLPAEA